MMIYLLSETGLQEVVQFERSLISKYGSVLEARAAFEQKGVKLYNPNDNEEDDTNPVGYSLQGNVAVLSISGATRAGTSWLTRMFGIPTYQDIQMRFQQAFEDTGAKVVMMDINSPGGEAAGTGVLANFIDSFNSKIKPVVSYTSGVLMSAAVWYGTSASAVAAGEDAMIGSVGAMRVYGTEYRANQANGIDIEVIRSAEYKAFPSPVEPISAKGKAVLQEGVNMWADKFIAGLSANIDVPIARVKSTIATGKEFSSSQALSLGLINSIIPREQLIANLNAKFDNRQ